jgi:hypothetical protein
MQVDPLIYERFIDEMAARGISLEVGSEPMIVSEFAEAIYSAQGAEIFASSVPSLERRMDDIRHIKERIRAAEWQWAHLWVLDSPDEPIDDSPGSVDPRYIAMRHLFDGDGQDVVAAEAAVCSYYGIKPGTFITAMCLVEEAVDRVLIAHGGAVVCFKTTQKLSAKQVVCSVLQKSRSRAELERTGIVFSKRLVEDILTILGILAIVRKPQEVRSLVALSPAEAIESERYQVQVRYADEIADTYLECAQEGHINSCMAKDYGVADGLSRQYGSLHGVHAAVVVYKDMTDMAGTRKPVARFLVERAVCVNCGTIHTVISRRYSDGSLFALSIAEFVAKCIADRTENSVMYGEGGMACRVCSYPLMTVLNLPVGLDHPVWSDWAPMSLLVQVPGKADIMELRFTSAVDIEQSVADRMVWQHVSGEHIDNEPLDPMSNPEVGRLYELACKLARIEEPPISQGRLILMIGDGIRKAKSTEGN